jgi:Zn-dependent protease with chaperone function
MSMLNSILFIPTAYQLGVGLANFKTINTDELNEETEMKDSLKEFIEQQQLNKEIKFLKYSGSDFPALATGNNISYIGKNACIFLRPEFYKADKDACSWVLKHEISHIKHNDLLLHRVVVGSCCLATSIFAKSYLSLIPALGLCLSMHLLSSFTISNWYESRADDFAIQNSSNEELKGGKAFFMSAARSNLIYREYVASVPSAIRNLLFSEKGDNRTDFSHPSLTSRIEKINKEIIRRNIEIIPEEEELKIKELLHYVTRWC